MHISLPEDANHNFTQHLPLDSNKLQTICITMQIKLLVEPGLEPGTQESKHVLFMAP